MNKQELLKELNALKKAKSPHIALYIKDSTFNTLHIFVYKPTEVKKLVDKIGSKYDDNSVFEDKEIIAVKGSESIDSLNSFYNTLIS